MIATNSPRAISRSTSLSAAIDPSPEGNSRRTPRSEMSGADIGLTSLPGAPAWRRLSPPANAGRRRPARLPRARNGISHRTLSSRPTCTAPSRRRSVGVDDFDRALALGVRRREAPRSGSSPRPWPRRARCAPGRSCRCAARRRDCRPRSGRNSRSPTRSTTRGGGGRSSWRSTTRNLGVGAQRVGSGIERQQRRLPLPLRLAENREDRLLADLHFRRVGFRDFRAHQHAVDPAENGDASAPTGRR